MQRGARMQTCALPHGTMGRLRRTCSPARARYARVLGVRPTWDFAKSSLYAQPAAVLRENQTKVENYG